jgi:hypothetical protein
MGLEPSLLKEWATAQSESEGRQIDSLLVALEKNLHELMPAIRAAAVQNENQTASLTLRCDFDLSDADAAYISVSGEVEAENPRATRQVRVSMAHNDTDDEFSTGSA